MLEIKNLSFRYKEAPVLQNIHFSLNKGENLSVIGESGCGKSTLLKLVYGLLQPEKGEIYWHGKKLLGPDFNLIPGEGFMKYVAQDFGLMPFTTVEENVGRNLSNMFPEKKRKRIHELLELVEMTGFAKTKARFLSGGQQQRVALASALAKEPEVMLLDEPFSNIDNFKKNKLRRELFTYFRENKITCLVATHDNADSLAYADNILVLKDGKQLQYGRPETVYNNPANFYTASLFGEVNELPAKYFNLDANENETVLLYPNQLTLTTAGGLKVKVCNNYFNGENFLIEAISHYGNVFFNHNNALKKNSEVNLGLNS